MAKTVDLPDSKIYDKDSDPNFILSQQAPVPPKTELSDVKLEPEIGTLKSPIKEEKPVMSTKLNTFFPEAPKNLADAIENKLKS